MKDTASPFDEDVAAYWARRYDLFSLFDYGIQLDRVGLYSVKPEAVANEIVKHIHGNHVIDGMCGVGGISIALAKAGKDVTAIDIDESRLRMAANNARVYGVADRIRFICGDVCEIFKKASADAVVLDPDWGGPDYSARSFFSLGDFMPDGRQLLNAAFQVTDSVVLCGPYQLDMEQIQRMNRKFHVRRNHLWGRVVCTTVSFG